MPKIYKSHYKPLDDEIRKKITEYVMEEHKEKILKEEALKSYNLIVSGKKTLEQAVSESTNLSLERITVGRTELKNSKLDANLLATIFSAKDKNLYRNIYRSKEPYIFQFAIVREVRLPAISPSFNKIKAIDTQLSNYLTDAIKQEFLNYLQSKYPVKVFPGTIKEL